MFPFTVKIFHSTTGELDFTESDGLASRVLDHQMRHELNYPKELTVVLSNLETDSTLNYLGDDFDGWTGTYEGPIMVGDIIQYDTIEMDTSTGSYSAKEESFFGVITEMNQAPDQTLTIKAKDFLERFEHISVSKTVFANYRDNYPCTWSMQNSAESGSKLAITLPESTLAYPPVGVWFAVEDNKWVLDDVADYDSETLTFGDYACQEFIAPTNGIYYFGFKYKTSGGWTEGNGHLVMKILRDNGSDYPDLSGTPVASLSFYVANAGSATWKYSAIEGGTAIVRLDEGEKYWFCIVNHNSVESTDTITILCNQSGTYLSNHTSAHHRDYIEETIPYWINCLGTLSIVLWTCQLSECSPDTYHFETISATPYLILDKSPGKWESSVLAIPGGSFSADLKRGIVSYYYGTKQVHEVMDTIVPLDYEYFKETYNRSVDTNIDATISLYRTKGKTLGACLRELCDLIAWQSGKQCSMAVLRPHGETYQQLRISYRNSTSDATEHTFGPSNFIESIDATMTTTNRPCRIVVIGKTTAKGTITATVEDDDWKTQAKFTITETIQDDTIQTVSNAFARARGTLEGYKRGIWEGTMRLAGVFPQLMHDHYEYGNPKWGDGAIIEVTWPELGWSSLKLKVTGTTLGPDYTEVRFSNADALLNNKFVRNIKNQQRSDSFISPTDSESILYLPIYMPSGFGWTYGTYLELETSSGTPITNHKRVAGTYFDTTNPARRVWHFEVDAKNGYTADGSPITCLGWFVSYTGIPIHYTTFSDELSASYNFYKWKTTKVIIDLVIDAV